MKIATRHICAIAGISVSVAAVIFTSSLTATNDHQSTAVANALLEKVPVEIDANIFQFSLDYRPDGRVMQGPPMRAILATDSSITENGIVVTRALFEQRSLSVPDIGTLITLVGEKRAYQLPIIKILDWSKTSGRGALYPNAFVSLNTANNFDENKTPFVSPSVEKLAAGFVSDAQRQFNQAKILLLWAAAITSLALLINALLLSVETQRKEIAILRSLGLTKRGVIWRVSLEALALSFAGLIIGFSLAMLALFGFVLFEKATYPAGMAIASFETIITAIATIVVAILSSAIALRPALAVKPLEKESAETPKPRPLPLIIAVALGFASFVAVEVWGASLMRAFVPSPEWPDAIVSFLPSGVSAFDIGKIKNIPEVTKIAELQPLQVNILPLEEMKSFGKRKEFRNALLLASDYLPQFKFVAGSYDEATNALKNGDACIISEMMARARGLSLGDSLALDCGRAHHMILKIVGIVDLNWHLVTSRALLRGLNRKPGNTDGPVFVSFDTLAACDLRPQHNVKMTHVWLDFDKKFVDAVGVFEAGRIVEKAIANEFDEENTIRLHARDEIADGTLARGANLIGSISRVPFIFVAILSIGFISLLVASASARQREFAVLHAVGATRLQLASLLIHEAFSVAIKGVLVAIPVGILAGWLFTFATRKAMSTWGIPNYFAFPAETIFLGAFIFICITLLVAIPTSLHLIKKRN